MPLIPPEPVAGIAASPLSHIQVRDAMRQGVISRSHETPLREVAAAMADNHIHSVVVTGPAVVGAAPAWSSVRAIDLVAATMDGQLDTLLAGDIATPAAVTVGSTQRLDLAIRLMLTHDVEHLLVIGSQDGRPVGMLSTLDIAGLLATG